MAKRTVNNTIIDLCSSSPDSFPPKYLNGFFSRTHLDTHPNTGFKFHELIDKSQLQKAFFSSFAVELDWLIQHIPKTIPVCLVEHWSTTSSQEGNRLITPNLLVCHPPLCGRQNMHAKLMLLCYPEFLRVVVTSANLVSYDWSLLENVLFIQDFPKATDMVPKKRNWSLPTQSTTFKDDLSLFLQKLKVPATVLEILDPFDFKRSKVELIISVPGTHTGQDYGRMNLGKKLRKLIPSIDSATDASLIYQTSSLGSVTDQSIQVFWEAVYPSLVHQKPNVKIVFPSRETVLSSRLGADGGNTIFFNSFNYDTTFPKNILHDAISLREGTLSHAKIISGTLFSPCNASTSTSSHSLTWLYCGSHNFSAAAWGTSPKRPRSTLTISNYDIGVISLEPDFPLPFLSPPPAYTNNDVPWIQPGLFYRNKKVD